MSKNMTRASVALTAAATLVAGTMAGTPAFATGQADTSFVSLAPTNGLAYNVLAIAGQDFSLSSNQASSITASGRTLKFRVSDPNDAVDVASTSLGITLSAQIDDNLVVSLDGSNDTVTITDSDLADALSQGERVILTGDLEVADAAAPTANTTETVISANTVITVGAVDPTANTVVLKTNVDLSAIDLSSNDPAGDTLGELDTVNGAEVVKVLANARSSSTKTFVVESGLDTNTGNKVLVLENLASTSSVSVEVTAWVDDNGNGVIDTTEYKSPTRTITWVRPSNVVPTITWSPVVIGDETAVATVSLSPTINFDQQSAANFEVDVNRQGSSATIGSDDGSLVAESWDGDDQEWTITSTLKLTDRTVVTWTGLRTPAVTPLTNASTPAITHYAQSGTTVTFTTGAAHNYAVNDEITVTTFLTSAANAKITAVSDFTFSYTTTAASATTAKTAIGANAPSVALNEFGFATAGEYKATVKIGSTPAKIGETSVISAGTQVAAGVKNRATVTTNVTAGFVVRKDHVADVQVTSTVTNSDGIAVAAGIPVSIAVTETSTGIVTVNGTTVTTSRTINTTTNASGQVVITVKNTSGAAGETVQLAVSSQGFSDTDTLTWTAAAYALQDDLDNSTNGINERSVSSGGELPFNLKLADQWGAAPAGDFRVKITGGSTRYDFVSYASMTSGAVNWTLTDAPVDASDTQGTVVFAVQQKNSAGSWVAPNGTSPLVALKADGNGEIEGDTVNVNVRGSNGSSVSLNADGVSSADLSVASAVKAVVAADTRSPGVSANDLSLETSDVTATLTGTIKDKFTGVAQAGSLVTISGNAAILFENGVQAKFGSISVIADGSGTFSVNAYSNSGQTDSVVTVAANGASSTVKVTFTGAAADGGTTIELATPATAAPGTTFQVSAVLKDKYGNGVQVSTAGDIKVTYTGPGLIVGTLPNTTDKDGKLTFSVLLGSGDSGNAVVTVSYDQNSDDDFLDAKDLTTSKTISVGAAEASATIGSFNGRVAVRVENAKGSTVSVKIGKSWYKYSAISNNYLQSWKSRKGASVAVSVYVDGELQNVQTITVK